MIKTDTTLDQDSGTEGNCVCMYNVHCRVIVDNMCDFHQKIKKRKEKKKPGKIEKHEKISLTNVPRTRATQCG